MFGGSEQRRIRCFSGTLPSTRCSNGFTSTVATPISINDRRLLRMTPDEGERFHPPWDASKWGGNTQEARWFYEQGFAQALPWMDAGNFAKAFKEAKIIDEQLGFFIMEMTLFMTGMADAMAIALQNVALSMGRAWNASMTISEFLNAVAGIVASEYGCEDVVDAETQWWFNQGKQQGEAWMQIDWQNHQHMHEILAEANSIDDRMWRLGEEMTAFLQGLSQGLGFNTKHTLSEVVQTFCDAWMERRPSSDVQTFQIRKSHGDEALLLSR